MEKEKKTRKPRQPRIEITETNYMDFSAKALYREIEKLRTKSGNETATQLKAEIKTLRQKLTRIGKLAEK